MARSSNLFTITVHCALYLVNSVKRLAGFSIIQSTTNRMKPGEKEVNTLLRNEASCLFFFKPPIRSRSPLLTGSRLIFLPLATQMFQFAKFEKSKERRLATELGYGFPIGDPWITDGISPWPFASSSVLPSQCPGIHPMHSFRSCTDGTRNTNPISTKKKGLQLHQKPRFVDVNARFVMLV